MEKQQSKPGKPASRLAMAIPIAAVLTACASTPSSVAEQPKAAEGPAAPAGGHGLSAFIGGLDANRDGVEENAIAEKTFKRTDTNADGKIDNTDGDKP